MKICITSQGRDLESSVDPRFGRCQYFLIIDIDTLQFEALENPYIATRGGAGIQSAGLVAKKDAKVVLTGNVGPNAFETLNAAGVEVIAGVTGKVQDVIEKYLKGEYKPTNKATAPSHFGMGGKNK